MKANVITLGLTSVQLDLMRKKRGVDQRGPTAMVAARVIEARLKRHFQEKNSTPNKQGFPRSNFWAQISDAVLSFEKSDHAIVQVNDPRFNQKYYGGKITPKSSKYLTIPVHPAAYGKRASTFADLVLLRVGPKKTLVLARRTAEMGEILETYYLLVDSVTQAKDPTALPPQSELEEVAKDAVTRYLDEVLA